MAERSLPHRNLSVHQLRRRLQVGGDDDEEREITEGRSRPRITAGRFAPGGRSRTSNLIISETPPADQHLTVEMIMDVFSDVSRNPIACNGFQIDAWYRRYNALQKKANFPQLAILVEYIGNIYGRRVDYLHFIVHHMAGGVQNEEQQPGTSASTSKPVKRKATPYIRGAVPDDEIEFMPAEGKCTTREALTTAVPHLTIDKRNKFVQLQELCAEFRGNPPKQRKIEIINRVRDEACIVPTISSNNLALRTQILDFDSGESIGTRYDFQTYINYIDLQTGSLMAEHDLYHFFRKCLVIRHMQEQQSHLTADCQELAVPADVPQKNRNMKLFMPLEYLQRQHGIVLHDSSDYDNELQEARNERFREDPIFKFLPSEQRDWSDDIMTSTPMRGKEMMPLELISPIGSFSSSDDVVAREPDSGVPCSGQVESMPLVPETGALPESTTENFFDLGPEVEIPFSLSEPSEPRVDVELFSITHASGLDTWRCSLSRSPPASPLCNYDEMLVEETPPKAKAAPRRQLLPTSEKATPEKLSARQPAATTPLLMSNVKSSSTRLNDLMIPRPPLLRPLNGLRLNILNLPEQVIMKHLPFHLTMEYRKYKMEIMRTRTKLANDVVRVKVFSLKPKAGKQQPTRNRAPSPVEQDFHGFDELEDLYGTFNHNLYSMDPVVQSRSSTPESDFHGFSDDRAKRGTKPQDDPEQQQNDNDAVTVPLKPVDGAATATSGEVNVESANQPATAEGVASNGLQPATPVRTMSRDSGYEAEVELSGGEQRAVSNNVGSPMRTIDNDDEGNVDPQAAIANAKCIEKAAEFKARMENVSEWHRKLTPLLKDSEKRNHFDINECGTIIIETFDADVDPESPTARPLVTTLANVIENQPPYSTARMFLSTLMLANTNNIEISTGNTDPDRLTSTEDIKLRLLSRRRHYEKMKALGDSMPCGSRPSSSKKRKGPSYSEEAGTSDYGYMPSAQDLNAAGCSFLSEISTEERNAFEVSKRLRQDSGVRIGHGSSHHLVSSTPVVRNQRVGPNPEPPPPGRMAYITSSPAYNTSADSGYTTINIDEHD